MNLLEKLTKAQSATNSLLCVGLDPDFDKLPATTKTFSASSKREVNFALTEFCLEIIKKTAEYTCAFKPNLAFFEAHGRGGYDALLDITSFLKQQYPDHLLIIDGKRGDIGNTAERYALALKVLKADAVTVNPYLGPKTLAPFFNQGLGVISLCVTSNPDAAIFQNLPVVMPDGSQKAMYLHIAETLQKQFGPTGNLGLVTGATHPQELAVVRQTIGHDVLLLIPGIGKQSGDLEATLEANAGGPAVINASSSIIYASSGDDYAEAAGLAAKKLRDQINETRNKLNT